MNASRTGPARAAALSVRVRFRIAGGRVIPPFCFFLVAIGCGTAQSEICRQYIGCQAEYDAASQTGPVDVAQYETDGICWASVENAATCDGYCTEGIEALRDAAANASLDVPSCG